MEHVVGWLQHNYRCLRICADTESIICPSGVPPPFQYTCVCAALVLSLRSSFPGQTRWLGYSISAANYDWIFLTDLLNGYFIN